MALPVYISDKDVMTQVVAALKEVGLSLHRMGGLKSTAEGTEQVWKCCDDAGDLFFFSTGELNEKNALRLKRGTFFLIPGPRARARTRKEIAEAYNSFECTLAALGVRQMPRK